MDYEDYVQIHYIEKYDELLDIIRGKSEWGDLRRNFVFRGMKNTKYKLVPSALRKDEYGNLNINKYISNEEFKFYLNISYDEVKEIDKIWNEFGSDLSGNGRAVFTINKNNEVDSTQYSEYITSFNELQFKREVYVLLKFLKHADNLGLKINTSPNIRRWIHNATNYTIDNYEVWPKPEFYEIISLAQHNSLPTRALDWSYDYKVSLHFAVQDIINNDTEDCILWAFNYKLFENHYYNDEFDDIVFKTHYHTKDFIFLKDEFKNYIPPFEIYRPEYNPNNNLKSQKGLFTFVNSVNFKNLNSSKSFDEIIVDILKENIDEYNHYKIKGFRKFNIEENEKVFHKFIISGDLKKEILKDLHAENYSKETLFPQFDKIVESMKEHVDFEDIINKPHKKTDILLPITENRWNLIKNNAIDTIHISNYNNELYGKAFIIVDNIVYSYFHVNEIIKNSVDRFWLRYGSLLNISKHEFLSYFKDDSLGFEIKINKLIHFDYKIPINEFSANKEIHNIKNYENLKFLLNFK